MLSHNEALQKADPLLRSRLCSASDDDKLRVVLALCSEQSARQVPSFGRYEGQSRQEARLAMIQKRRHRVAEQIDDTVKQLDRFPLKIECGEMSGFVTVEGRAKDIFEALKLQGVRNAHLDRDLSLIEPRKRAILAF